MDKDPAVLWVDGDMSPKSVSDLLRAVSNKAAELYKEARAKLDNGDAVGFKASILARAQLVQSLPEILADYREAGGVVPEGVNNIAFGLSSVAIESIKSGRETGVAFGMSSILDIQGSTKGEPNILELLAIEYDAQPAVAK